MTQTPRARDLLLYFSSSSRISVAAANRFIFHPSHSFFFPTAPLDGSTRWPRWRGQNSRNSGFARQPDGDAVKRRNIQKRNRWRNFTQPCSFPSQKSNSGLNKVSNPVENLYIWAWRRGYSAAAPCRNPADHRSLTQSVCESVSDSVSDSVSQWLSQSVSQWISYTVRESVSDSASQSVSLFGF